MQWKYNLPSEKIVKKVKPEELYRMFSPLHETSLAKEKVRGGSLQIGKADLMLKIIDYLLQEQLISPAEKIELVNLIRGDETSW